MEDGIIGVTLEIPVSEFRGMTPEQATHEVMSRTAETARRKVEEDGGVFDINRVESFESSIRTSALGLGDFVCVIASWRAEKPA